MVVNKKDDEKYELIIGRHVPVKSPNFLLGAVQESLEYEANALMIYLGAPQNSIRRSLSRLKIPEFQEILKQNKINIANVIVHGPYIINLANISDPKVFAWSVEFLKKEMVRLKEVGLKT